MLRMTEVGCAVLSFKGESARRRVASSEAPKYCSNEAEARHLSEHNALSTRSESKAHQRCLNNAGFGF